MTEVSEAVPVEAVPVEAVPVEAVPVEAVPVEAVPVEAVPVEAAKPSSLGIWAFVLAILGLIGVLPIVGSVLGLVLGRVAVRRADARRLRGGRGLAFAAVTIAAITLVVVALAVAAYALAIAYLEI